MIKKDPLKYNGIIMVLLIIFIISVGLIFITIAKENYIEVSGEIKPIVYQIVAPEISGIIKKIYFHDGDIVKKGDLLLELKDEDFLYQLKSYNKKIELLILEKEEKGNKLNIKKYNKEIESLKLEIQNIKEKLNKCKVYSKVSGILFEENNYPKEGLFFKAGTEIQKIFSNTKIYAEVFIPEKDYSKVKINQKVKLFINAFPYTKYKVFDGKVIQLKSVKVKKFKDGYTAMVLITDPYFNIIENNKVEEKKLFFGLSLHARIYIEKKKLFEYLIQ